MEKYIPKMSYYLISKMRISKAFDSLVTSIVYAEQHSQDKRQNYLENLEDLAQKIVALELKDALRLQEICWQVVSM